MNMLFKSGTQDRQPDLEKAINQASRQVVATLARPEPVLQRANLYSNKSFTSSTSTIAAEKAQLNDLQLPKKKYGRTYRNLRYTFFEVYHRLNLLVVLSNVAVIVVLSITHHLFDMDPMWLGTAAAANIVAAVLIRQELIINLLFASFGKCPTWFPLRIRRLAAKIYHLGGVHSGAGIAAMVWFGMLNYPIFRDSYPLSYRYFRLAMTVLTMILDFLLLSIVMLSHPLLRARFHNTWEGIHRYAGWAAVGLFWAHAILSTEGARRLEARRLTLAEALGRNPVFWCLFVSTMALIIPWLRLRRVPVRAEPLSDHAVRLHLGYTNLPLCAAPRFSDSPLKEWHAFAGIPEEDGAGFSILVSKAGDWTSKIIKSPPKELWTRGIPARGVLHVAPIFNRLILVATGSGIGPILSLIYARNLNARIIWSTPDPIKTYQQSIVDQIRLADPYAMIINTTREGRPDLMKEAYKQYVAYNAEAVFIISNPKVTRKVVYGLECRGIPIFAPIFDS